MLTDLSEALFPAELVSAVCLIGLTTIAGIDGLYFHLLRYRLHSRPASRYEHLLHTLNAILFVPLVALTFCSQPLGLWRWGGVALLLSSIVIEVLDVRCEEASRRDLGGLSRNEYLMHFLMSGLRAGTVLPILCAAPVAWWAPSATQLAPRPLWLLLTGAWIAGPAVLIAGLHIYLWFSGQREINDRERKESQRTQRAA